MMVKKQKEKQGAGIPISSLCLQRPEDFLLSPMSLRCLGWGWGIPSILAEADFDLAHSRLARERAQLITYFLCKHEDLG